MSVLFPVSRAIVLFVVLFSTGERAFAGEVDLSIPRDHVAWVNVLNSECPIGAPSKAELGPLGLAVVGAVATGVVNAAFDLIGPALEAAAEGKAVSVTARQTASLYLVSKNSESGGLLEAKILPKCLVVSIGKRSNEDADCKALFPKEMVGKDLTNETCQLLKNDLKLAARPIVYAEFALTLPPKSIDLTAFRLVPVFFSYSRHLIKSNWDSGKGEVRDVTLVVSMKRPKEDGSSAAFLSSQFVFDRVAPNAVLQSEELRGMTTEWFALPSLSDRLVTIQKTQEELRTKIEAVAATREDLEFVCPLNPNALQRLKCDEISLREDIRRRDIASSSEIETAELALSDKEDYLDLIRRKYAAGLYSKAEEDYTVAVLETQKSIEVLALKVSMARRMHSDNIATEMLRNELSGKGALRETKKTESELVRVLNKSFEDLKLPSYDVPFAVEVLITESKKGSPFLKTLAKVFGSSKEKLKEAASTALVPAERERVKQVAIDKKEADQTAKESASQAALEAMIVVRKAELALASLGADAKLEERILAEEELKSAKLKANAAYRKAGRVEPYPGVF